MIKVSKYAGFCFGVKRAYETVLSELEKGELKINGELVHNKDVMNQLQKLGLIKYTENPVDSRVVIRSHGMPLNDKNTLSKNNQIIDATCPVLTNIYKKIIKAQNESKKIIIIGDKNHPEILALNGHINKEAIIINTIDEAEKIVNQNNLYIISQTTNIYEHFKEISDIIRGNNLDVEVVNTICNATKTRQEDAIKLAKDSDAMIVIGGRNSSNTKKLFEICNMYNKNTFWIENKKELDFSQFIKYNSIGITAGASTPSWIIEEVTNYMENLSKDEFMEQVEGSITKIYPKDIVKGEIIYVTDDEVIVNIGYRADGIVKLDELSTDPNAKPRDLFEEGQEIEVYVIKLDDGEGNVVLSTRRVEGLKNWKKLVEASQNSETVKVKITKEVKGGLLGTTMGIVAFLPGSQITTYFVKDLSQFIGQELECKIVSADEKKRRLVVSRRVIKEAEEKKKLDEAWSKLEENQTLTGKVARLTDFGAFVNLGGVDGLIHISDLSWNRVKHPSEVLTVGQEIEVVINKLNREKNRISLGYKQLHKKPFEEFMENNAVGDVVKGTVVNLVDFGAFIRLSEGVEGLVHVSQISHEHIEKPSDELTIGDEVEAKILEINPETKRIALSIKALKEPKVKEVKSVVEDEKSEEAHVEREPRNRRPKKQRRQKTNEIEGFKNEDLDTSIGALLDFDLSDLSSTDAE